jgi:hypothetical protein
MMYVILSRETLWTAAAPAAAFENLIQSGGCATALHSDFVAKEQFLRARRSLPVQDVAAASVPLPVELHWSHGADAHRS